MIVIALVCVFVAIGLVGCELPREQPERRVQSPAPRPVAAAPAELVTIVEFAPGSEPMGPVTVEKVVLSDEEWGRRLTPLAFSVTRRAGTELAFTGKYNKHYEPGIYRCIGCNTALFRSETKFDSGTGWPSFWDVIAKENVYTEQDQSFGVTRDELRCRRCDSHLGHVFPDGPEPTGLRYCMNSVALVFEPLQAGR